MFQRRSLTVSVAGKELNLETGQMARQANGAVLARSGETVILATACAAEEMHEHAEFFPLRVDYQEKFSSAGKTLKGFIKREGRPAEREILVSRFIDRPLRPMFPDGYFNEVQVLAYVLSYDGIHNPDHVAICAASAALLISDIPFLKPVAAVRMGMIGGQFIVNPTVEEQKASKLDLLIAGTHDAILMIEGHCDFLTEKEILTAVQEGHLAIRHICSRLADWQQEVGKPKLIPALRLPSHELSQAMHDFVHKQLDSALRISEKSKREQAIRKIKEEISAHFLPDGQEVKYSKIDVMASFKQIHSDFMRDMILHENRRIDGRSSDHIRPIDVELSPLPRTHGSALFTRGETQSLAVCTLGGEDMGQRFEDLNSEGTARFYLQYSFPPFSVGEVGRLGAPGRREIGHGKLAERALSQTLPGLEKFPYTIRLESNILESNGSSSMASVCSGCLAMMEAGVPIERPVAGIAMGLIRKEERFAVLSDILGDEDALGDMDFKVAGDAEGITAFQLDIKVEGITTEIIQVALIQAKAGRVHILNKMLSSCPKSKEFLSKYAPHIETMQIKPSKIGTVIGPGGKQIRAIIETTGVQIDINDNGLVSIVSNNREAMEKAKAIIDNLTAEVVIGKVYEGKIVSIVAFGCFVELPGGKEGLCHISELSHSRIANVADHYKEGETLSVQVIEINDRGQVRLSHKVLLPKP
jgi:polyribonucleotide nucleotidyltransferase